MPEDVNTPDGFEAFMRKAEGGTQESQEGEEAVAPEVATPPEKEGAAPNKGEVDDSPEFQAGYAKALGEQSEKLGAERVARESLEKRLASLESELEPEPSGAITDETWEMLEGLYDSQGGAGMMLALASRPDASEDLIDAGIALWKENDYRNADLYEKRMMRQIAQIEPADQGGHQDPDVVALKARTATEDALVTITSEYGRERLEQIQPHLASALEKAPERLRGVLGEDFQSGDKDRIVDAFRTLYTLAEPLAGSTVAKTAADQRAAASRVAKQAATVATGSQAHVGQGESDLPTTQEELDALAPDARRLAVKKIMTQRLLNQETSVARELAKSKSS